MERTDPAQDVWDFLRTHGVELGEPIYLPRPADQKAAEFGKKICAGCEQENPEAKVCSRCRLVNYCNAACQRMHWPVHKPNCHEPVMTSMMIEQGVGDVKRFVAPMRLHRKEDIKQPHTRPTGVASIKPGRIKEVVSSQEPVLGLKQVDLADLEELLAEQKYSKIMQHVQAETDFSFRLSWLKTQAEKGHVILMFLTAADETDLLEAYKWRTLGYAHALLDIACHTDPSLVQQANLLLHTCNVPDLPKELIPKIKELQKGWIRSIRLEKLLSPEWLTQSSTLAYMGVNTCQPKENWLALRTQKLQELIAAL